VCAQHRQLLGQRRLHQLNTDNCDANATCANTSGSFTCACDAGYSGDGVTCTDLDECALNTDDCSADAACTNTVGSFTCACNSGYSGNGVTCTDNDECTLNTDNCDANATCTNTLGSFTCACNSGYVGDGVTCSPSNDPCANYGGTRLDVNANIKVCNTPLTWGAWNPALIGSGWTVCDLTQWAAYAPAATPQSFGLGTLWINNGSCGAGSHREVYDGYLMNDVNCYNGASCCWSDSTVLQFAVCAAPIDVTFNTCGNVGNAGPSQAQCDTTYAGTELQGKVTLAAGYQRWTVPYTATYTIESWGAQGGNHNFGPGGLGAHVKGNFALTQGQQLKILVGQKGMDGTMYNVGGGGGTYVAHIDNTPLLVAGGGGGAGNCGAIDALKITGKSALGDGTGGVGGNDGGWCGCGGDGSAGGGFLTNGSPSGGFAFVNGGLGDSTERPSQCVDSGLGGFGGGGNGGNGGGGGGGYEGGDAGGSLTGTPTGNGGKSFNSGASASGEDGVWAGAGKVRITLAP